MKTTFLILLLFFPLFSFAEIEVKKSGKKSAIVSFDDENLKRGDFLYFEGCKLRVLKVKKGKAQISKRRCNQLAKGDVLSTEPGGSSSSGTSGKLQKGLTFHLGYSMADKLAYDVADATSVNAAEEIGSAAIGLGVGYYAPVYDDIWIHAVLAYELSRELSEFTFGSTSGSFITAPSMTLITLEGIGAYYIDELHLDFGLVIALPSYSASTDAFAALDSLDTSFGFKIGAGYRFLPYLSAELYYRYLLLGTSVLPAANVETNEADFSGILLRIVYHADFL